MNKLMKAPQRLAKRILPFRQKAASKALLSTLPAFAVPAEAIEVLPDPAAFRHPDQLLHVPEGALCRA